MKKPYFLSAIILALVAAILSSCAFTEFFTRSVLDEPDEQDEREEPAPAVRNITVARYSGEQISPYGSESRANRDIISLCYGALVTLDSSLNAVPQICESFEIVGNKVIFYLN